MSPSYVPNFLKFLPGAEIFLITQKKIKLCLYAISYGTPKLASLLQNFFTDSYWVPALEKVEKCRKSRLKAIFHKLNES